MSFLPDYRNMKREFNGPTIEEILAKDIKCSDDKFMSPKEMLELADAMEKGTYRGFINLAMSWDETIKQLRKGAYEKMCNQQKRS